MKFTFTELKHQVKDYLRPAYHRLKYRYAKTRNVEKLKKMTQTTRWGIIGTGSIAKALAHALSLLPDTTLVAVGSRSQDTADAFGAQFGVPKCYPTYEQLVNDPDVEMIYVSTPHPLHYENTIAALEAGKGVLCEKPFAMNVWETAEMIRVARERNLFLMEAMWTRYLPAISKARELVQTGRIGELKFFQADFGFKAKYDVEGRLFNKELGGGTLLDIGIYPLSLASMFLGTPDIITSEALIGTTGVDEQFAATLRYQGGQIGSVGATFLSLTPCTATIAGTEGNLRIHSRFYKGESFTLMATNGDEETFHLPIEGSGYKYQVEEITRCLAEGKKESPLMPLDETLSIMQTLDRIRAPWGLKYPNEKWG